MDLNNIDEDLFSKVSEAAKESFEEYRNGFDKMNPSEVYKTAFINGYNCAYNIYDVAEEKIEAFRKDGEVPEKDIPDLSASGSDRAKDHLQKNGSRICSLDRREAYTMGYQEGFSGAWNEFINRPSDGKLDELVNYYLGGKDDNRLI